MIYMLDTANIEEIRAGIALFPISGVTTNPTIISKENKDFLEIIKNIQLVLGEEKMLHVQVLSTTYEGILEEAKFLKSKIKGNLYVKIPVSPEGIKAMKILSKSNFNTTATAIITPQQALMAAECGAKFLAPYVNRIDDIGGNGIEVVKEISNLLKLNNLDAKILGASFKNTNQVHSTILAGAESVTISYTTIFQLINHPLTNKSIENFTKDWESVYYKKTIL